MFNIKRALARGRRFGSATDGQIALMFGLLSALLIATAGGSLDLMRAYNTRQKLSETAALACQFASRPSILKLARSDTVIPAGGKSYPDTVNAYIESALSAQQVAWTPTYAFVPVQNGPANVTLSLMVPTAFLRVVRIDLIPVSATAHCYDSPANTPDPVYVTKEGFEARGTPTTHWFHDWATYGIHGKFSSTPTSTASKTALYTGTDNAAWHGNGYCLETDRVGVISSTAPEGQQTAELDCENGSGSAGNSAISTRVQLYDGNYELRYNYRSRVSYPNYDPAYLCGSTASDLSWANDTRSAGGPVSNALRTNQINVYLDRTSETFTAAPLHSTMDNTQQLAGSNLIDMCVYSFNWVERSVRIRVTTPGYYWLSFAADGQNDSFGGQIDNIRLCVDTCPGTPQDSFPASWQAANNGGSNKVLFRDGFDAPAYTQDPFIAFNRTKGANLANSVGTTGTAQSGWPSQAASGWATGPYNQVNMWLQGAYQGNQYVSMQGWNGYSTGTDSLNRLVSRKFLLDPGYYNISYGYISMIDFSATSGIFGTDCFSAPSSGAIYPTLATSRLGRARFANADAPISFGTNVLGVFLSHGQLVSTLNANTAMGMASNGAASQSTTGGQATYTNPDGTVTTVPAIPPDRVNWLAYDATANNPVIDTCGYAAGYSWMPRSTNVKITKPGWYWLTFSAQGNEVYGTGNGPGIDDVKLTALGSPYMAPPAGAVTVPAPGPPPDSRLAFDGFFIVADPFKPTAARQ